MTDQWLQQTDQFRLESLGPAHPAYAKSGFTERRIWEHTGRGPDDWEVIAHFTGMWAKKDASRMWTHLTTGDIR